MRGSVLVVDDQLRARRLLVTELREAGFEVSEAGNGAEGWAEFQRRRPEVVITDLVMPRADGLELLKQIRAHSEVPVIVYVSPPGSSADSAGAVITMAADIAAMAPQTNIGSSTPISLGGEDISKDLRRKVINDAAAYVGELAREHDRNVPAARRMVIGPQPPIQIAGGTAGTGSIRPLTV